MFMNGGVTEYGKRLLLNGAKNHYPDVSDPRLFRFIDSVYYAAGRSLRGINPGTDIFTLDSRSKFERNTRHWIDLLLHGTGVHGVDSTKIEGETVDHAIQLVLGTPAAG